MKKPPNENVRITTIDFWTKKIGKENLVFSFVIPFLCLYIAVVGLTGCFLTTFSVSVNKVTLFVILFFISLFWTIFSRWNTDGMTRFLAFMAVLIFLNVILFIMQNQATSGFFQIVDAIFKSLNDSYHGSLDLYDVGTNESNQIIFLTYVLITITGILSLGILRKQNIWCVAAVVFPILFFCCLVQGKPDRIYLVLLFLSLLAVLIQGALSEPFHIKTKEEENPTKHYIQEIKSKVVLISFLPVLVISVLSFAVLQPILKKPVSYAREAGAETENGILQLIWQVMPGISDSDLQLEGVGGGVDEGALGKTEGFYFGNTKALKVTCQEKPAETLYLKGYIGSVYTGNSFDAGSSKSLENASNGWNVDGDIFIYIQNLPFLRMMYAENIIFSEGSEEDAQLSEDITSSAQEIQVENLNANTSYTYLPYNTFLNDYYEILAGDGAVESQTRAEDIFSYYPLTDFQEKMEEWQEKEDAHGVLDKIEASYESYVKSNYLQIPGTGLEDLQAQCEDTDLEEIDEIKQFIIKYLDENASFEMDVESVPEGEDFVSWFLYDSKEGYSTHFAASATMMFRMFGVPARYVVGYTAPESLFSMQSDGSYMAIVEDDNAHAWTEIYLSGIGWVPVETTPGYVAMLSEDSSNLQTNDAESTEKESENLSSEEDLESSEEKTETPVEGQIESDNLMAVVFLILKIFSAIFAGAVVIFFIFIIRRKFVRKKRLGELSQGNLSDKIKYLYQSLYSLWLFDGWMEAPSCEEEDFSQRMSEKYTVSTQEEWKEVSEIVLKTYYGYDERSEEDLVFLRKVYSIVGKEIYSHLSSGKRWIFSWWKCYL